MYPILLKIGPLVIHTYGLLVALGFLATLLITTILLYVFTGIVLIIYFGAATPEQRRAMEAERGTTE